MDNSASGTLDATLPAPLAHPVFTAALQDLAAVGVEVSPTPARGAAPYALIGARSNARWWLVPLETGRLAASGLALFQPVLPSARCIKTIASWLSRARLQYLWARRKVYISVGPELARLTGRSDTTRFAFFTGTDSPHRKVAVQIMDSAGVIHAFAKITRDPGVAALLVHEAQVLRRLESLELQSVSIPRVLWADRVANATVLATDTLKTPASHSPTELTPAHLDFVCELARCTQGAKRTPGEVAEQFRARLDRATGRISAPWRQRLLRAVECLAHHPQQLQVQTSLCHGDFTPWNTFLSGRTLYVFDWEYAADESLPGHDVAHFALNASSSASLAPGERYERARHHVIQACPELGTTLVDVCLLAYLLSLCLRFVERAPMSADGSNAGWEREAEHAALLDYALTARCAGSS
jgi:hypothetical protein